MSLYRGKNKNKLIMGVSLFLLFSVGYYIYDVLEENKVGEELHSFVWTTSEWNFDKQSPGDNFHVIIKFDESTVELRTRKAGTETVTEHYSMTAEEMNSLEKLLKKVMHEYQIGVSIPPYTECFIIEGFAEDTKRCIPSVSDYEEYQFTIHYKVYQVNQHHDQLYEVQFVEPFASSKPTPKALSDVQDYVNEIVDSKR